MAVWPRQARLQLAPARIALAAVAVFTVAVAVLVTVRSERGSGERLSHGDAIAAALHDTSVRRYLAGTAYSRERVTPIDDRLVRVSFFDGHRIVLDAAVAPDGRVTNQILYKRHYVRIGSEVAQRPLVLALLVAAFVLATAVARFRSIRNLDVLALASFVVPVVLINARLLEASVYAAYPPLAYLCVRCARVAFREQRQVEAPAPLVRPRPRTLAFAAGAAAIGFVMLSIPGGLVGDVALASLAGATKLTHGVLPYGHLPQNELVHGDTYPLLAYVAYIPAALITPVRDGFDQVDGALWVATAFALLGAVAMYRVGKRSGEGTGGLRLVLAWLCFPPVVIAASGGSNDLAAAACVAWAVALSVHAARSTAALALAGGIKLAPLLALPAWVFRERGGTLTRALLSASAVAGSIVIWVLAAGGTGGLGDMVHAISFQAERGSLLSLWTLTGADAAQLAVQAAVVALVVVGTVQVWRDRSLARDPRRIAGLAAAVLLGAQIAANYWTYAYLPWVFPLVALALLTESRVRA